MKREQTNWLEVLGELCAGDTFGHESWFVFGVERHKSFYYCFIGDCSATEGDAWDVLRGKENRNKVFAGKHSYILEGAVVNALAQAFDFLANSPFYFEKEGRRSGSHGEGVLGKLGE